jgi:hypothetical protein
MKRLLSFLVLFFTLTCVLFIKGKRIYSYGSLPVKFSFPFLLFTISILSFQCKKGNPDSDKGLPPASQTGQDIFACRVNGEPWISERGRPNLGGGFANGSTDSLVIYSKRKKEDKLTIERFFLYLNGSYIKNIATYQLNDSLKKYALYLTLGDNQCITSSGGYGNPGERKSIDGKLNFTKVDTEDKIMAGTFEFTIVTDFCDTLKITDGRFDIKYQ